MRFFMPFCVCIALAACSDEREWFPGPGGSGGLYGKSAETLLVENRAVDDAKCHEYGFEQGTEAYGNCRLKLEEIRALRQSRSATPARQVYSQSMPQPAAPLPDFQQQQHQFQQQQQLKEQQHFQRQRRMYDVFPQLQPGSGIQPVPAGCRATIGGC